MRRCKYRVRFATEEAWNGTTLRAAEMIEPEPSAQTAFWLGSFQSLSCEARVLRWILWGGDEEGARISLLFATQRDEASGAKEKARRTMARQGMPVPWRTYATSSRRATCVRSMNAGF